MYQEINHKETDWEIGITKNLLERYLNLLHGVALPTSHLAQCWQSPYFVSSLFRTSARSHNQILSSQFPLVSLLVDHLQNKLGTKMNGAILRFKSYQFLVSVQVDSLVPSCHYSSFPLCTLPSEKIRNSKLPNFSHV